MIFRKNTAQPVSENTQRDVKPVKDNPHREAFTYESARNVLLIKNARHGWTTASVFALTTILSIIAVFRMLPLKEQNPYVVEVDKTTGAAVVLQPVGKEKAVPHSELMDKHFLVQYIRARENYDNRTVAGDFNVVRYLSMPDVFAPYAAQFKSNSPNNPDEIYATKSSVRIQVTSVTVDKANDRAVIRYIRRIISNMTQRPTETSYWIATLGFEYFPDYKRTEKELIENPLGFKVTSFRTDQEFNAPAMKINPSVPSPLEDPKAGLRPEEIIIISPDSKEADKYLPPELRKQLQVNEPQGEQK